MFLHLIKQAALLNYQMWGFLRIPYVSLLCYPLPWSHEWTLRLRLLWTLFVTLIDFLPIINQIPQFLTKGKFFLQRERERDILGSAHLRVHPYPFLNELVRDRWEVRALLYHPPFLFYLSRPLLQSLGLQRRACKLAGTVKQTGGYNF